MSKSTLSIAIPTYRGVADRTVEVPCHLPDAFNFRHGGWIFTANIYGDAVNGPAISSVETEADDGLSVEHHDGALEAAEQILATIKAALGITGPVPPGSPLPAIALAYEAEVAAYEACTKAHRALPPAIAGAAMYWREPKEDSRSSLILSDYINYVMEQACKAQTERAEAESKEVK